MLKSWSIVRLSRWMNLPVVRVAWFAAAEHLLSKGYNPQHVLYIRCTDIDPLAADMCFIQLALFGLPASVYTGNALTMKMSRIRHTPIYYANDWSERLRLVEMITKFKAVLQAV